MGVGPRYLDKNILPRIVVRIWKYWIMRDINPGQWWQRVLAFVLLFTSIVLMVLWQKQLILGLAVIISCLLFFLFFLLSFRSLYERWEAISKLLGTWMIRLLFSFVYFLVLPFYWLVRGMNHLERRNDQQQSFWVSRRQSSDSLDDLQRMG